MSVETGIQWTDSTWNPVRGCSRVSEGCRNCYAERVAARFSAKPSGQEDGHGNPILLPGPFHGFAENTTQGPRWTGKVALVEKHLLDPLRWKKPRRIFVNSMSDLFHESLPFEEIDKVFAVMNLAHRHTFQILTKRPERMLAYFERLRTYVSIHGGEGPLSAIHDAICNDGHIVPSGWKSEEAVPDVGRLWPLPNVWLGVSTEDQATADERIPLLLQTSAAVRFISAEPLLGAVDLSRYLVSDWEGDPSVPGGTRTVQDALDWIIVGGESGSGARPCDVRWIESIRDQCRAASVPAFIKQMGGNLLVPNDRILDRWPGEAAPDDSYEPDHQGELCHLRLVDRKGGDPAEWPEDLRVQEFPA